MDSAQELPGKNKHWEGDYTLEIVPGQVWYTPVGITKGHCLRILKVYTTFPSGWWLSLSQGKTPSVEECYRDTSVFVEVEQHPSGKKMVMNEYSLRFFHVYVWDNETCTEKRAMKLGDGSKAQYYGDFNVTAWKCNNCQKVIRPFYLRELQLEGPYYTCPDCNKGDLTSFDKWRCSVESCDFAFKLIDIKDTKVYGRKDTHLFCSLCGDNKPTYGDKFPKTKKTN